MLNKDIIYELSKHLDRSTLFKLINCCASTKQFEQVFFDKYVITDKNIFENLTLELLIKPIIANYLIQFITKIQCIKITHWQNYIIVSHFKKQFKTLILTSASEINNNIIQCDELVLENCAWSSEFPVGIKKLSIQGHHSRNIYGMPDSIRSFAFSARGNPDIKPWSRSLKELYLHGDYNRKLVDLPDGLMVLNLGYHFDSEITYLPDTIEHIRFGQVFDQYITKWPVNLKSLSFGVAHDRPLDNLPVGLLKLNLSTNFTRPINNLPGTLVELDLGENYNLPLKNLPVSLKILHLPCYFNQPIDDLPDSIEYLEIRGNYSQVINKLPLNLKKLLVPTNYLYKRDLAKLCYSTRLRELIFTPGPSRY